MNLVDEINQELSENKDSELKKNCPYCGNSTGNPTAEPGVLFAIIPDDQTRTMILYSMEEGQTAIKLTEETSKILIAMLDRQIQEWL